jgi:hypothetical protein
MVQVTPIDSLTINRSSTDYIGLFGYSLGATVDSLGLTNVNIQRDGYTTGRCPALLL